jgi:hypothetical protein
MFLLLPRTELDRHRKHPSASVDKTTLVGVRRPSTVRRVEMPCKSCQSQNQRNLDAEIGIHYPGRKGLDKPLVFVFPKLLVCLDCGFTEFAIPETELRRLARDEFTAA